MRLEHLNLVVSDIDTALHFYQAAFPHWRIRSEGESAWNGKPRRWLHYGDDYQYLAFGDNGEGDNRDLAGHQTGLAHLAWEVNDLDGIVERLAVAGYEPSHAGADNPHRRNVYFIDPHGFEVEFVEYGSDLPGERNNDL